jgi:C4-dicarboxylate-specific signal transduction histidine kinase
MPSSVSFGLSPEAAWIIACAAERGLLHDISQPLSAIRNYAHVLRTSPSAGRMPEAQLTLIHRLDAEIERTVEILRGAGLTELQSIESCDLIKALEEAADLIDHTGEALGQMTLPVAPMTVAGARPVIALVLFSVLEAAMAGGGAARVSVTAAEDGAVVAIASPGGAGPIQNGRGLGLLLCRRIAQVLGGSLVEEGIADGSRSWCLRLPLAGGACES